MEAHITRSGPLRARHNVCAYYVPMMLSNPTTPDQILALLAKSAGVMQGDLHRYHHDLVKRAIEDINHPFWSEFQELCRTSFTNTLAPHLISIQYQLTESAEKRVPSL